MFTTAPKAATALGAAGVEVVEVARDARGRPDLGAVLTELAKRGLTRLLVEGGATVLPRFWIADLADRLEIFTRADRCSAARGIARSTRWPP